MTTKSYIGDGVYVDTDAYGAIVLTTEDGYRATNRIVLEPEVYAALERYRRVASAVVPAEGPREPQSSENLRCPKHPKATVAWCDDDCTYRCDSCGLQAVEPAP